MTFFHNSDNKYHIMHTKLNSLNIQANCCGVELWNVRTIYL